MIARIAVLAVLLAAMPQEASANVIWPAAILTGRIFTWWVIAASLLIEVLFVRQAFGLPPLKAMLATLAANAASAIVGLFALPYGGMFLELGIFHAGGEAVGWDTFGVAAWAMTFILAVAINLAVELPVYRFGYGLNIDRRAFWLIALANIMTVGLAFASLDIVKDPTYGEVSPGLLPN